MGTMGVTHGAVLVDAWKQCSFYFEDVILSEFVSIGGGRANVKSSLRLKFPGPHFKGHMATSY